MAKIMWTPDHDPICAQSWRNLYYNVFVCRSSMIFLGRGLIGILTAHQASFPGISDQPH